MGINLVFSSEGGIEIEDVWGKRAEEDVSTLKEEVAKERIKICNVEFYKTLLGWLYHTEWEG